MQAATSDQPPAATLQITVSNPPANFYYLATAQYTALTKVDADLFTSGQGSIRLDFWPPRQMAAGVYSDNVHLRICSDSLCAQVIAESSVPVSYTVTGLPVTSFNVIPSSSTQLEAKSTESDTKTFKISMTVFDIPAQGLYAKFVETPKSGTQKVITGASFSQTGASDNGTVSAQVTLSLAAPTTLQARRYESDLQIYLCFESSCANAVRGSPIAIPLGYLIYASEGREYSKTELSIGAKYAAWDPFSQKLYVVQGFTDGTNSLVAVDPATGVVGTPVPLPDESSMIVLSDDGQFAYVASTYGAAVHRFRLPGLQPDGTIHLAPFRQVYRIAVAPGAPHTIAISQIGNTAQDTLVVYDDLARRGQEVTPATFIAWGANSSELYSTSSGVGLYKWPVEPTGLAAPSPIPSTGGVGVGGQMFFQSGLLYSNSGGSFNPVTGTFQKYLDAIGGGGTVAIDHAQDRVFRFDIGQAGLKSYTLSTGKELSVAWYPRQISGGTQMPPPVRWGANGLALVTMDQQLILINGSFVAQ